MPSTRLSQRGQVVIPKSIRDRLGLEEGQVLDVEEEAGVIRMRPHRASKAGKEADWRSWRGLLAGSRALQELEAEHRREIAAER